MRVAVCEIFQQPRLTDLFIKDEICTQADLAIFFTSFSTDLNHTIDDAYLSMPNAFLQFRRRVLEHLNLVAMTFSQLQMHQRT